MKSHLKQTKINIFHVNFHVNFLSGQLFTPWIGSASRSVWSLVRIRMESCTDPHGVLYGSALQYIYADPHHCNNFSEMQIWRVLFLLTVLYKCTTVIRDRFLFAFKNTVVKKKGFSWSYPAVTWIRLDPYTQIWYLWG